jgi:integral membrane protein
MPPAIRPVDVPRIRTVLKVYRVSAILTGVFLIGLVVMMVLRYGFKVDIEFGGPFGLFALTQVGHLTAVNFSILLLSLHGWLYVLYLGLDFLMWRMIRWSFGRFLFIALGGVVPFLSFFFEFRVPRWVHEELDAVEPEPAVAVA